MLEVIQSDTFWSAVSALATLAGAAAIVYAARQLRFEAWLKAQEIWGSDDFIVDRSKVFARLQDLRQPWTPEEKVVGLRVCRKVDEFVRLAPYFGERRMLTVWGNPLATAWVVLDPLVRDERDKTDWQTKWNAFETLGKKALSTQPHLQAKQQEANQAPNPTMEGDARKNGARPPHCERWARREKGKRNDSRLCVS